MIFSLLVLYLCLTCKKHCSWCMRQTWHTTYIKLATLLLWLKARSFNHIHFWLEFDWTVQLIRICIKTITFFRKKFGMMWGRKVGQNLSHFQMINDQEKLSLPSQSTFSQEKRQCLLLAECVVLEKLKCYTHKKWTSF